EIEGELRIGPRKPTVDVPVRHRCRAFLVDVDVRRIEALVLGLAGDQHGNSSSRRRSIRGAPDTCQARSPIVARVAEHGTLAIIGSGPGLGSALARRFAQEGWSVALVALHQEVVDAGLTELEAFGVDTCGARADVTDHDEVERAFDSIAGALAVPDAVIYNASIYQA